MTVPQPATLPTPSLEQSSGQQEAGRAERTDEGGEVAVETGDGHSASSQQPPEGTDESDAEMESYDLPLDQVFECLKNSRRRETLRYLKDTGEPTTLSELAEHIAALENNTTVRKITSAERKRVYVGLYQCHLPKMDDFDIISYDQNRGTIALGPNAPQLYTYIEDDQELPWHRIYAAIALGAGLLFVAAQAGAASIGVTPTAVLLLLCSGITVTAVAHSLAERETVR